MALTSRTVGNAFANLMGGAFPALATVATIPFIVAGLGSDAYGVLVLVTSIMGYFAIIDINVTAGAVKFVSEHHARGEHQQVHQVLTFGLLVYILIGLAGMAGLWLGSDWLINHLFKIPDALRQDSIEAVRWSALGFLVGQLQSYLQSVPQALQRYDITGKAEAFLGGAVPVVTMALVMAGHGLIDVVILRVAAGCIHCLWLLRAIRVLLPRFRLTRPPAEVRQRVLSFSAYSFLSRLAAITYSHADKLLLGAMVGVQQVTWFTVASTVANRLLLLTSRLSNVMFPVASALSAKQQMDRLESVYLQASRYMCYINGMAVVLVVCFAEPLLTHWMGAEFALHGTVILMVVAAGQFVDSLTNLPSLMNDGLGHPRVSGLFAVTRAVVGLGILYVGVLWLGGVGAAWAHLAASALATVAFIAYVHGRTVPVTVSRLLTHGFVRPLSVLSAVAVVCVAQWLWLPLQSLPMFLLCGLFSTGLLIVAGWQWVLTDEHRSSLATRLGSLRS